MSAINLKNLTEKGNYLWGNIGHQGSYCIHNRDVITDYEELHQIEDECEIVDLVFKAKGNFLLHLIKKDLTTKDVVFYPSDSVLFVNTFGYPVYVLLFEHQGNLTLKISSHYMSKADNEFFKAGYCEGTRKLTAQ